MDILRNVFQEEDWPEDAEEMYERIEVLGRGSFGLVWMGRRCIPPVDEYDDEYVALKNIEIKEDKGKVYAQREISILSELRHPNVIRLIRAFPIYKETSRLVALQLARGPNLQRVVSKRGALGLPLARLVCRQLVAAVSYLHGRAVLHRDIKPTNCILENTELPPNEYYDYSADSLIWSDADDAEMACESGKWKVMLVDFGFARALEEKEIFDQPKNLRGSILLESKPGGGLSKAFMDALDTLSDASDIDEETADGLAKQAADALRGESIKEDEALASQSSFRMRRSYISTLQELDETSDGESDDEVDEKKKESPVTDKMQDSAAHASLNSTLTPPPPPVDTPTKQRPSLIQRAARNLITRQSTTRRKMRSMSALGTKAYAAPEIKHQLRNKTDADTSKKNAALTECVADYGMIVDAYSVGWTLRVILTGVPPNATISSYMRKHHGRLLEERQEEVGCCCFGGPVDIPEAEKPRFRVRDTDDMPVAATLFISMLTKQNPEERMTVREAQDHSWIKGGEKEIKYNVVQGDVPSHCGDPVVPLTCARELSRIVEEHHQ